MLTPTSVCFAGLALSVVFVPLLRRSCSTHLHTVEGTDNFIGNFTRGNWILAFHICLCHKSISDSPGWVKASRRAASKYMTEKLVFCWRAPQLHCRTQHDGWTLKFGVFVSSWQRQKFCAVWQHLSDKPVSWSSLTYLLYVVINFQAGALYILHQLAVFWLMYLQLGYK